MRQDLRYAVRQLLRTPAFTAIAVLTLAIGIGVNTTLFTFANAILFRPAPGVHASDRLAWITSYSTPGRVGRAMSYMDFLDYRDSSAAFESAAAFGNSYFSVSAGDQPERVRGQFVSGSFFSLLGVRMAAGRAFTSDDDTPSARPVAVIGYGLWQDRLGGDPGIAGRTLSVNGQSFVIAGIAPEGFNGADIDERRRDVWVPIAAAARIVPGVRLDARDDSWLSAFGRLTPRVSIERATGAVATIAARIAAADSAGHASVSAAAEPMRGAVRPSDVSDITPVAGLAAGASALILLICCANVGNMLLARAVGRRREVGVRLSLGATRRRLVQQMLIESLLLAGIAGVFALLLSLWSADILMQTLLPTVGVPLDVRGLVFTAAISLVSAIFFGLAPALNATRGDLSAALKDSTLGFDRRRARLQGSFVVAQISLSLVLLVTSGMFVDGLVRAARTRPGFEATSHALAASFDLGMQGYTPERAAGFVTALEQRVAALPGVSDVSVTNAVPLGERRIGVSIGLDPREVNGVNPLRGDVYANTVRPGFFRTLGIGIETGRDFAATDVKGAPGTIVVSEDFARAAWPGSQPIGKHVSIDGKDGPFLTVIGVARDALIFGVGERKRPIVYVSQLQFPNERDLTLLVRSPGDATTLAPAIRREIRALDRGVAVYAMESLGQYRHDRLADMSIGSILLGIVGTLAAALASVGLCAVVAFSIGQRTREIGVRVALGAVGRQIVSLFVREGVRLAAAGLAVGIVLAALAARTLSSMFVGVASTDVITFVLIAMLLAGVALLASWIPARRAARVDPMVALRSG